MYEKFLEIKEKKSWLFYLLIIPFAIVFIYEMYNKYLTNSGKEIMKDARKKDEDLKAEQVKAEEGAKQHKEEADKIEEKINKETPDKDWHLK